MLREMFCEFLAVRASTIRLANYYPPGDKIDWLIEFVV